MLRTCIAGVNEVDGKFDVEFKTFRIIDLGTQEQYVAFTCKSPAQFATEDEAYSAGARALDVLERTGKFPNMCEEF